jgi:hypothetical protein
VHTGGQDFRTQKCYSVAQEIKRGTDLSIVTRNPRIQFDQFFPQLSYKRGARIRVSHPRVGDWMGQNLMRTPPVGLIVWTC